MKSVMVTGGTIRLGKAIADYLREHGWKVITTSHRPDSGADIIVDFREKDAAGKCYTQVKQLLGGDYPDALVNNAALFRGSVADLESVNFDMPLVLTLMMNDRAERGKPSSVVNILDAKKRKGKYGELKQILREYNQIAVDMATASKRARVNSVSPGPVMLADDVHESAGNCPFGRPTPEDVAKAVLFLLETPTVAGVDIIVDGGQHGVII